MPSFLIPLHEYNTCHNPAGTPVGGQFCATEGGADRLISPGQSVNIVEEAHRKDPLQRSLSRRFLFNPQTRELVLSSFSDDTHNHAVVFNNALLQGRNVSAADVAAAAKRYDKFTVHGWLQPLYGNNGQPKPGSLDVIVSRTATVGEVETSDALFEFAKRLVGMGAPPHTSWSIGFGPGPLRKVYPELFPTKRRRAA